MLRYAVFCFVIWTLCCNANCEESSNYDDHTLYNLLPTNRRSLDAIRNFEIPDESIEVFKRSRALNDSFDVLVPPGKEKIVLGFAEKHGIQYKEKRNYGRSLDDVPTRRDHKRAYRGFNPFGYNSYTAIQEYLDGLVESHPELVKLQPLGKSYQGREMRLVRISKNPAAGNPSIFVDAGIHAREWVAPAMAMYLIHRLTNDGAALKEELDGVDWFILPMVNPDGYEFTRTSSSNRLWRKTRSKTNQNCYGVDGNRNYGYRWGVSGVSKNPCDRETYAGPKPFSEVETQMVRNVMVDNSDRLKLYVSLHSYGQYLVYPWGYTGEVLPKTWKKLDKMARTVSDAVQNAGGKPFRVMSAGKWYAAAGGSDDFAFGAVGIPYSYTMELTDGYEFRFPEQHLKLVLPQFYEGFRSFARQIKQEFGKSKPIISRESHDNSSY